MKMDAMINNLKSGDSEAWNMMVEKYSKSVYNLALNFAGNRDDASDITQDIFIKVYNNIEKFQDEKNFNSWLLRLARNHCIDYWRKNKNIRQKMELDEKIYDVAIHSDMHTPEDRIIIDNDAVYLREKLQTLSPDLRSLIIMRDIQSMSYQEIAEQLDIPLGTTKSRINRARLKLAKIVLKDGSR
ncbi:MAG: RNA polymerase sigma factor [bacterium]|nr:RNA polymerase sigma factor [bacterium]